jgi:hypothetical protein
MDDKTRTAAGIARQLQGLTFDDEPAAFASLMAREAK